MKDETSHEVYNLGWSFDKTRKVYELSSEDTIRSGVAEGSSISGKALEPIEWFKELVDAAKEELIFSQAARQAILPAGRAQGIIKYRKNYLASGDWNSPVTPGTLVNFTKLDNFDGILFSPADYNYAVAIGYDVFRTNAVDFMAAAREELAYKWAIQADNAVRDALKAATRSTSSAAGAQMVYGGTANGVGTSASTSIATGDVIDLELILKARRMLKSRDCYDAEDIAGAASKSSALKNPWSPTPGEPIILFVSEYQTEELMNDPTFSNVAESGTDKFLLTGEVASLPRYGIRIVETTRTPAYTTSDTDPDESEVWTADGHMCLMVKAKACSAIMWGLQPRFHLVDYPRELEKDIIMELAYEAKTIHTDAVVKMKVTDE